MPDCNAAAQTLFRLRTDQYPDDPSEEHLRVAVLFDFIQSCVPAAPATIPLVLVEAGPAKEEQKQHDQDSSGRLPIFCTGSANAHCACT